MLATGVAGANTWFNLGNARLKVGRSVRRCWPTSAPRGSRPGDPDIRANLAFAREQGGIDDAAPGWTRLLLRPWPARGRRRIAAGEAAVAWWLLALACRAALVPAVARPARWGAVVTAVVLLVLAHPRPYGW